MFYDNKNKKINIYEDEIELDPERDLRDYLDNLLGFEEDINPLHTEEEE